MTLQREIRKVVRGGNCAGCGGCDWLFDNVRMGLDSQGFLRPEVDSSIPDAPDASRTFRAMCPGVSVRAQADPGAQHHPVFGSYISAWQGWASNPDLRLKGSSGGVLSALSAWALSSDSTALVIASSADPENPSRTVAVQLTTRAEIERAATSRYAPVANLPLLAVAPAAKVVVGKPCEAVAVRQHEAFAEGDGVTAPLLLSFFCAGTPSQFATDRLVENLGVPVAEVEALQYRGDGWPGDFAVTGRSGHARKMSYQESWGKNLGRDLPWRCKLCAHGTGEGADLVVGDFWQSDEDGYPIFSEGEGNSVVIARTMRGHEALMAARRAGVVLLAPVDLDEAARIQPLQRKRRVELAGRLLGRLLAGKSIPRYRGFRLLSAALRHPYLVARSTAGTLRRTFREERRSPGRSRSDEG